jgi:prolyl oligopeptidase PreP (S9A serine peptidase family)
LPFGTSGSTVFVRTDKRRAQPRGRDHRAGRPGTAAWKTVVPERKEGIESVAFIGGRIVAQYLVDVQSRLSLFALDGAPLGEVKLPGTGTSAPLRRDDADVSGTRSRRRCRPRPIHRFDQRAGTDNDVRGGDAASGRERLRDAGALRHVEGRHQGAAAS